MDNSLIFNVEDGSKFCTINEEGKWQRGPKFFTTEELFPGEIFNYSDTLKGFDLVVTMDRDIAKQIDFDPKKLIYIAAVSWDLQGMNDFSKYIKISAHSEASDYGGHCVPRFVTNQNLVKEKIYITQLIEGWKNSIFTPR